MLRDAFFSLLQEKSFEAISIQDIAERSTVNRATFYDHYSDKPALVEDVIVERFDGLLCQRQVCFDGTCVFAIRPLILATCDFLGQLNQGQCTKHERLFEPFVQTAIQKRLQQVLLDGLKKNASKRSVDPRVTAAVVVGVPDERWGEAVHAFVTISNGASFPASDLKAFCHERLARYKCPKAIDIVSELPTTGIGKIARRQLRNQVLALRGDVNVQPR